MYATMQIRKVVLHVQIYIEPLSVQPTTTELQN